MNISVACLGGAGEIGMNMYVYETSKFALIVDCGVKFARPEDPGVDLIIPDFQYLESIYNQKEILLLITHGHEDHTGAIPFLLKKYDNISIVSTNYTIDLFRHKLTEHGISLDKVNNISPNTPFEWGDIEVTMIPISHSVHGTTAVKIKFQDGFIALHMSDYKIDMAPITSDPFPLLDFINLGKEGVNILASDSTNILNPHFTRGEFTVKDNLKKIFKESQGRIFFTTFASNTERLQTVFNIAKEFNRKIVIEGSSFYRNIEIARNHGKLYIDDTMIIPRKNMKKYNHNEILVVATGSQGEYSSVISRIAKNDYGNMDIIEGDTYIFSSRTIPGNEQYVLNIINNINKSNAMSYTAESFPIHVSGHASKYDAELLINLINPEYLLPVHGEAQHLKAHRNMAKELGMHEDNIITWYAGDKLYFEDGLFKGKEEIPAGKNFVDIKSGEILSLEELKNRRKLSTEGTVILILKDSIIKYMDKNTYFIDSIGFLSEYFNKDNLLLEIIKQIELYCKPMIGDYIDRLFNIQYTNLSKEDNYDIYEEFYKKIINESIQYNNIHVNNIFDYNDFIGELKKIIHKYFKKYYNIKPNIKIININGNLFN